MPAHSGDVISMVSAAAGAKSPKTARNAKHALLINKLDGNILMASILLVKV
jgi:hypothetical protein